DLYVEGGSSGGDIDMLIGAGCVKAMNISYIANSGFTMVCRRFREAVENGTLPVEDYSLDVQTIAYHGAALGLSYVAVKNMLGSDLEARWGISEEERKKYPKLPPKKFILQDDPFHPGSRLCLIPTPELDVACVHVQKASPEGICRIEGAAFQDADIAIAAKRTIISCEELVTDEEMRRDPNANTLPGLCVDAVVHMPYGAHPSQCYGFYDYDSVAFREYDKASRTQADFEKFVEAYVLPTHEAYVQKIGEEQLSRLRVDPEYGYVRGLRRK
ncbi:MAG: CoA-transferase, partial [Oscillospiraceae bacterium]